MLTISLISCRATKINKQQEETKTTVITEAIVHEQTKLIDSTLTNEIVIEPIDTSKTFIINGKEFKNVRFKAIKKQNSIKILNKTESSLNQRKTTLNKVDNKQVKKEESKFQWWVLIVGIILAGILINKIKNIY